MINPMNYLEALERIIDVGADGVKSGKMNVTAYYESLKMLLENLIDYPCDEQDKIYIYEIIENKFNEMKKYIENA